MVSARPGSEFDRGVTDSAAAWGQLFPEWRSGLLSGVETLHIEGRLPSGEEVGRLLREQVLGRWAECDRAVITAAHRAGDDLEAVAAADRALEAVTLPKEMREGSRRAGAALLEVHCQLTTRNAQAYQERVGRDTAPGHLAACQGTALARRRAQ